MLTNYLKIALRTLRKQAGYSLINIGGLGLGLACTFLIVLYVQHELSFDRFHEHGDQVYRLIIHSEGDGWSQRQAITASGFAPDLKDRYPDIEQAVRMDFRSPYLHVGNESRAAQGFLFVDPEVFQVFSFPLVRGNPETALEDPHALVLTETTARTLFDDRDPIGQVVTYSDKFDMTVTGIVEDVPATSHVQFNYLASFKAMTELMGADALHEYTNFNYYTYLMLKPGTDPAELEAKFRDFAVERFGEEAAQNRRLELQPVADIHLTTDIRWDIGTNTDPRYLYIFGAIAAFILLIACVNFMNLATARATKRAKEVGVRKVVGAHRGHLVAQFLSESVLLSILALVLALGGTVVALPFFRDVIGSSVQFQASSFGTLASLVGIGLLAGVAAGSYPAFHLSAFRPSQVLKGTTARSHRAALLRKGLIVVQFGISVFLIISTMTVYNQLTYMRTKHLGFEKEQVVFAPLVPPVRESYEAFRQTLLTNPSVMNVAQAGNLPGRVNTSRGYNWPGQSTATEGEEEGRSFYTVLASPDYIETLGLDLVAGRTFSRDRPTDLEDAYILNETAVRELGWDDPVGHPFRAWDREMGTVIGVVQDFHFKSLHQEIEPVVLNVKPDWNGYVVMRIAPDNVPETVDELQTEWATFAPSYPFDYHFLDEDFDRLYRKEERLGQLFGVFAFIAIFVACLGLFGLAAYSAAQRTKEIGIRKVLGASVRDIVVLLSKEFTLLVLVAFIVAAPVAYLVMNRWLEDFAYRIGIGVGTFVLAAVLGLVIAWLTVSYQSIKAALTDPVKSLRYE